MGTYTPKYIHIYIHMYKNMNPCMDVCSYRLLLLLLAISAANFQNPLKKSRCRNKCQIEMIMKFYRTASLNGFAEYERRLYAFSTNCSSSVAQLTATFCMYQHDQQNAIFASCKWKTKKTKMLRIKRHLLIK